jgi:hypothetical protein
MKKGRKPLLFKVGRQEARRQEARGREARGREARGKEAERVTDYG